MKIEKFFSNPYTDEDSAIPSSIESEILFYRQYVEMYYKYINPSMIFVSEKRFLNERCQYFRNVDAIIESINKDIKEQSIIENEPTHLSIECIHELCFSKRWSHSSITYHIDTWYFKAVIEIDDCTGEASMKKIEIYENHNEENSILRKSMNFIFDFIDMISEKYKRSGFLDLGIPDMSDETIDRIASAIIGDNKYENGI